MRHRLRDHKLGRTTAHRRALMSALVGALIEQRKIRTTLPKARSARSAAERVVTIARGGTLADRRRVAAVLRRKELVRMLYEHVLPACADRRGGYTRIVKLGRRRSDGAEMAILEWVNLAPIKRAPRPAKGEGEKAKPDETKADDRT